MSYDMVIHLERIPVYQITVLYTYQTCHFDISKLGLSLLSLYMAIFFVCGGGVGGGGWGGGGGGGGGVGGGGGGVGGGGGGGAITYCLTSWCIWLTNSSRRHGRLARVAYLGTHHLIWIFDILPQCVLLKVITLLCEAPNSGDSIGSLGQLFN